MRVLTVCNTLISCMPSKRDKGSGPEFAFQISLDVA
jgi:hypothetical protein